MDSMGCAASCNPLKTAASLPHLAASSRHACIPAGPKCKEALLTDGLTDGTHIQLVSSQPVKQELNEFALHVSYEGPLPPGLTPLTFGGIGGNTRRILFW
eukprot:5429890-Alexandrium_andersonii.AAC.1